jgi:thiamine-phosphate pyrophosphorylase
MIKNNFINTTRSIANKRKNKNYSKLKVRIPYIWFFSDSIKTKNPLTILKQLPKNSGVVVRSYNDDNKQKIISDAINEKTKRLLTVLVAGKFKKASNLDGIHYPKWANNSQNRKYKIISISAHSGRDIRRSINVKANLAFISPVFISSSHNNNKSLGVVKLGLLARLFKIPVIALGGINNANVAKLKGLPISGCAGIDVFL